MFDEEKYVPYSGRRYKVTKEGIVLDKNNQKIEVKVRNGLEFVNLEWVLGKRDYLVGLVVLITYKNVNLPIYLWDEIEPLYQDNDISNNTPSNLTYRFRNGPLEIETHPGYYYIPFATNYGIRKDGTIINHITDKNKTWAKTKPHAGRNAKGGYSYTRVVPDHGRDMVLFRHRALCFVFKKYSSDVNSLIVNHKDGNPENDCLSNIEWSTYLNNNKHAIRNGLRLKVIPVLVKDLKTGKITRYNSCFECGKALGYVRGDPIRSRLKANPVKINPDMLLFKWDDGTPWPDVDLNTLRITYCSTGEDILARNIFTGEIIMFEGSYEGQRITGIKSETILNHLHKKQLLPIKGFNFKLFSDKNPWPIHTKKHLACYKDNPINPPHGVDVIDTTTGETWFYTCRIKAAKEFKVTPQHISLLCNTGKLHRGKYKFIKFDLLDNLRSA